MLQISGKDLGALAMKGFCPRCFWIQRREDGFALGFAAKIVPVELDEAMLAPLFARAAQIHACDAPPAAREGCGDCASLEKIRGLLG